MKRMIAVAVLSVLGFEAIRLIMGGAGESMATAQGNPTANQVAKYTCSMHPQIILDHVDICPLCGMDLTPVRNDGGGWEEEDPRVRLVLSDAACRMADVGSVEIRRRELFKEIRTAGKVVVDETRVAEVSARIRGAIDRVLADSPGVAVQQGDVLVNIFSPEVYPAQQRFLLTKGQNVAATAALAEESSSKLYVPRRRLEFWGMSDAQIDKLANATEGSDFLEICAPISGTIVEKKVRTGQFVEEGDVLYTIADLSQVWLLLEIYETDFSWLRLGQSVQITLESEPLRPAIGKVGFIEPVLNEPTRTVRVRVILENPEGRFKPGMYAQAVVRIPVLSDGSTAPTGLEGKYLCPMHPYDVADQPSDCSRCGMALREIPGTPVDESSPSNQLVLALPAEAVLTTGRRQLVYLEVEPGKYRLVEPKLGPRAGDYYPIISGLTEGDRVVTRGGFLLDSQFQITGKSSLLYPRNDGLEQVPEGFTAKEWANFGRLPESARQAAMDQRDCPGCGMNLGALGMPHRFEINGRAIYLCCRGCENTVRKNPEAALQKTTAIRQAP
jgi:Cu(I)/Ag(I) efflux system membrane fusion protein